MRRILAVNWQDLKHPAAGGAEVHLEEILRRLAKRGHEVDLLCCNFPGGKPEEVIEGVRVVRRGSRPYFNWVAPFAIRRLLRLKKYDIVFEDINKIPFYGPLYVDRPLLVIIPHLFSNSIFQEINFLLGSYIYLFERPFSYVYRKNHIMVISESTAEEMISRGIKQSQVHVVKCGIDHSVYNPDSNMPKFDVPTILYVGRIKKYKSLETAIRALPIIRNSIPARLVVVGTGDHLPDLKKMVASLGMLGAVEFKGFISQEAKVDVLRRAHLLIYPSLKEGWGLTNVEANACGTPVLAARVPGLRDSVADGKSGLLFEYGNVTEFVEKAVRILADHEYRGKLQAGALNFASQFSWDRAADQTEIGRAHV